MLITVELLLADNLRHSLLTVGELDISTQPRLERVVECYTERFATLPPGMWYRQYQGRRWLTRSLPGPAFFMFLSRWRNIPEVRCFLESHERFVFASRQSVRKRAVMYGYISLKTGDSVTTGHFPGSHAAQANSPRDGIIVAVTAEM